MHNDLKAMVTTWVMMVAVIIFTWLMNLITFIQTITADGFVWVEVAIFTIVQGAAVVVWPLAVVTGPLSLLF